MAHRNTLSVRKPSSLFEAAAGLAILGLLAAALFPVVAQARESSKNSSRFAAYHAACLGASLYAADYDGDDDLIPTGVHGRKETNKPIGQAGGGGSGSGIVFHGGPVMTNTTHVYYIWYGDWSNTGSAQEILRDFAAHIGGSSYFNINTTYYNSAGTPVKNLVSFNGEYLYPGTVASGSLSDGNIQTIVINSIGAGKLPSDPDGVYFVLTGPSVTKSGFCTSYCGWHTHASISSNDIKYSFVGNPATQCMSACGVQSPGPNGNAGADAMVSIVAHELEEAVTDPDLNAWYDRRGYENADKCAWTFGTTSGSTGAKFNVTLPSSTAGFTSRNYLIQQNWVNAGSGGCTVHYP